MTHHHFQTLLTTHPAFMLYFYNDTCGVCKTFVAAGGGAGEGEISKD
jgi:hypothetical protein